MIKPPNSSMDPYIANIESVAARTRLKHREMERKSPSQLQAIQNESKLYKPFRSESHRTLEAQILLKESA